MGRACGMDGKWKGVRRILEGKPEGKPVGRPRMKWEVDYTGDVGKL